MENPGTIIQLSPEGGAVDPIRGRYPGLLSLCLEAVLTARLHLGITEDPPNAVDNFLSAHLAQVMIHGVAPDHVRLTRVSQGPWSVFEEIRTSRGRQQRWQVAISHGRVALLLHGLRILEQDRRPATYDQLAFVGRACYRNAAGLMPDEDLEGRAYDAVTKRFNDCSDIIGQASAELGFVDQLPPGLIT